MPALIERFELRSALCDRDATPSLTGSGVVLADSAPSRGRYARAAALEWEGVDLNVLAALFSVVTATQVVALARGTPTGAFARRIWFLYEWLTEHRLDVPDPGKVRSVPVVDAEPSDRRHRSDAPQDANARRLTARAPPIARDSPFVENAHPRATSRRRTVRFDVDWAP